MTAGTESEILKRLDEWEGKESHLPKSLELYRKLLDIQSEARIRVGNPRISLNKDMINRLASGVPLLKFEDLSLDWQLVSDVYDEIIGLFAEYPEVLGKLSEYQIDSNSRLTSLEEVTKLWFGGGQFPSQMAIGNIKGDILEFVIQTTLRPFLINHCQAFLSFVDQETWRRGYCPICGGSPDFAFLDKESGARWLLCSRCDAKWLFQRLECPYCGNQEQNSLAYFTDEDSLYRLYVCEHCRHYLKAIDLRQSKYEVLLPLERLLTLDLDIQAQKDGYSPNLKAR